jgi:hypothetical protein
MTPKITRRTLIAGGLAAPALLTLGRGARAATNLTLGHNAAPSRCSRACGPAPST